MNTVARVKFKVANSNFLLKCSFKKIAILQFFFENAELLNAALKQACEMGPLKLFPHYFQSKFKEYISFFLSRNSKISQIKITKVELFNF